MSITTQIAAGVSELITSNGADIEQCLAQSKDGKLSVSVSCKLVQTNTATHVQMKISYSQRHSANDELVVQRDDPNQPELIGGQA